jgi:hypothetical protein
MHMSAMLRFVISWKADSLTDNVEGCTVILKAQRLLSVKLTALFHTRTDNALPTADVT